MVETVRNTLRRRLIGLNVASISAASPNAVPMASFGVLCGSIVLWALSLDSIEPREFSDFGMISELPPVFFAALFLLATSFSLALLGRRVLSLLALNVIAQVLVFFGTPSFVEYGPRTQSAWRLGGISDYISETQTIDRGIDVFFNWPGFFIVVAFITRAADLANSLELARWAPLFFNLAYALPLVVIFRSLALDGRQVWLGLWLFFAGNWIGQDYLSPQALAYFMYLVIIALLLVVFPSPLGGTSVAPKVKPSSSRARTATIAFVLLLFALIVPSHQLTPWVVTLSVSGLVLVRRLPSFGVPLVMALMAATWIGFFTGPFLSGHSEAVASSVGALGTNVGENIGSRYEGSPGHLFAIRFRIGFTLAIAALALWGGFRLRRAGAPLRTIAVLTCAPFLMVGFQSYGGELLLRTYLFALPFLAVAGAAALVPLYSKQSRLGPAAATALLLVASLGFFATRYGNEKMDFFTKAEVAAVKFAYATVPPGAQLFAAYANVPWRYEHYDDYAYRYLDNSDVTEPSVSEIVDDLEEAPEPAYLLLTRSQFAGGELLRGWRADTRARLRSALLASDRFELLFENGDGMVLKLRRRAPPSESP